MEDATLYVSPFTYKNYSLFGVFDGHGGTLSFYPKVLKLHYSLKSILCLSFRKMKVLKKEILKKLFKKLF